MALHEGHAQREVLDQLRYQPIAKRITALGAGGEVVARSDRAVLVKEPRRVVDQYAVPLADVRAVVAPTPAGTPPPDRPAFDLQGPVYPPGGFRWHTTTGGEVDVAGLTAVGFTPDDPDLDGYVVLDFAAFDWLEEDEPVIGHPRSPYHRVDVRRSTRHVRIARGGTVLAESRRPRLAFETGLPVRYYLPAEDVDTSLLAPTDTRTICAYKGVASYWAVSVDGEELPDLVWAYLDPFPDAHELAGLYCFYDEKLDVTVDGDPAPRR